MKHLLLLPLLLLAFFSFGQTEKYSRVKIYTDESGIVQLAKAGVTLDHGELKKGFWFTSDFSATEIAIVRSNGFKYDILIDDVKQYYKDQNKENRSTGNPPAVSPQSIGCKVSPDYPTPSNFTLGSMGGFFTYSEIMWHLDNMATLYPNIVKAKTAIGTSTFEGNPVYWMKISDNVNTDEPEPEVLYTAAHHAREPASVSQLIMYMYYLCENYATDPEVKYLVDNEEMYFIPLVNPDGYSYNEATDPTGGGMWRKNRFDNGDGTFGIDLNRNYGKNWGYDNTGSSPNTNSDTYRGTAGFSEKETQNTRDFCNQHNFKLALNYHTYGNLLIYPYGYGNPSYTPDSAQFTDYGSFLTTYNKYVYGTTIQTVLYTANGGSDDWMYGEQTSKPKIMSFTPEAGRTDEGFWPPSSRIIDICKENIWQNLHFAHLALKYALATDDEPNYISATTGYFNYKIKRLGMDAPATYTVSIVPIGNTIASVGSSKTYASLNLMQELSDSISYTLNALNSGTIVKYLLTVNNGLYTFSDTIVKRFGSPIIAFASSGNSMTGWSSTTWGTNTTVYHTPTASITDSPGGNYPNKTTTTISTTNNVNLVNAISAQLVFWARWEIETNYDYAQVLATIDNGTTWIPLCGHYTKPGNTLQDFAKPLYDGYKFGWVKEEVSLDDYIGKNIKIRFKMVSDNGGAADGFYFDDLKVEKLISSSVGIEEQTINGIFVSQNMPNPAGDYTYINYSLEKGIDKATLFVYNTFGQLVIEEKVEGSEGNIMLNTSKLAQGIYYYVLRSGDQASQAFRLSVVK